MGGREGQRWFSEREEGIKTGERILILYVLSIISGNFLIDFVSNKLLITLS